MGVMARVRVYGLGMFPVWEKCEFRFSCNLITRSNEAEAVFQPSLKLLSAISQVC